MKTFFYLITAFLTLFCVISADKVGYVDTKKIRDSLKEYQEAKEKFNNEVSEWETQAKEMKKEIEDMTHELEKQRLLLNPQKVKERDGAIEAKRVEYQKFLNETWGENGKVFQREKELTKPIVEKILKVIKEVAVEEKYSMIHDVYESNIVYADEEYDITELVMKKLTEELE